MHMHVYVRDLLQGSRTDRVPYAHALTRKSPVDCSGDPDQGIHQPGANGGIKFPYVVDVFSRYHQHMSRVVLARIDKGDRQVVLVDDVPWRATRHDFAKDAFVAHDPGFWLAHRHCLLYYVNFATQSSRHS